MGRRNLSSRSYLRPFKGRRELFWVGGSLRFLGCPSSFGTISLFFTTVATGEGCLLSGIDCLWRSCSAVCWLMMKPFYIIFIYLASFHPGFPFSLEKSLSFFSVQVLENHPQENKYFTHYGWLPDLNGETVLGNLGLRSGYHQILLVTPLIHENRNFLDSPLGLVNTELELWQYPRFSSRVNTATEIFQHIIQTDSTSQQLSERGSAKAEAAGDMESVFTPEIQG